MVKSQRRVLRSIGTALRDLKAGQVCLRDLNISFMKEISLSQRKNGKKRRLKPPLQLLPRRNDDSISDIFFAYQLEGGSLNYLSNYSSYT